MTNVSVLATFEVVCCDQIHDDGCDCPEREAVLHVAGTVEDLGDDGYAVDIHRATDAGGVEARLSTRQESEVVQLLIETYERLQKTGPSAPRSGANL